MVSRPYQRFGILPVLIALAASAAGCSGTPERAAMMPAVEPAVQRAERVKIREFNDLLAGSAYYAPSAIVSGPKGDLWVTDTVDQDFGENAVIQIAKSGTRLNVFYYGGVISEGSYFADIAAGPDGALWISDSYNGQILRMSTSGSYDGFPLGSYSSGNVPLGIAAGPDGALWFVGTQNFIPAVGRITTSGAIKFFTTGITSSAYLRDIAVGPDGAMWFTETNTGKIGRITMHGKITEYSHGITYGAVPYSITAGPDKALWFTEEAGRIGRITTKGHVTEYSHGITPTEIPFGIAAGPDGALWFTESEVYGSYHYHAAKIGRITTSGSIHEYSGFSDQSDPTDIVAGTGKNMWFVESGLDELARLHT